MKTKFYALMLGSKSVETQVATTLFDKKANKTITKMESKLVKQPNSVLVVLETATSRAEAQKLATIHAKKNGLTLQSIQSFK